MSVVQSESAIISNTIFFCHHHTSISLRNMDVKINRVIYLTYKHYYLNCWCSVVQSAPYNVICLDLNQVSATLMLFFFPDRGRRQGVDESPSELKRHHQRFLGLTTFLCSTRLYCLGQSADRRPIQMSNLNFFVFRITISKIKNWNWSKWNFNILFVKTKTGKHAHTQSGMRTLHAYAWETAKLGTMQGVHFAFPHSWRVIHSATWTRICMYMYTCETNNFGTMWGACLHCLQLCISALQHALSISLSFSLFHTRTHTHTHTCLLYTSRCV